MTAFIHGVARCNDALPFEAKRRASPKSRQCLVPSSLVWRLDMLPHRFTSSSSSSDSVANSLSSSSSSSWTVSATEPSVASSFDAVLPDATTLAGFGVVAVVCAVAAYVWSTQVVPISRTKLALSKRQGGVRDYLDELQQADEVANFSSPKTKSFPSAETFDNDYDDYVETNDTSKNNDNSHPSSPDTVRNSRALERWLFTDWLEQRRRTTNSPGGGGGGRRKEPALPFLKTAKWNSGDNPILAATALIFLGVLVTSITERVFQ